MTYNQGLALSNKTGSKGRKLFVALDIFVFSVAVENKLGLCLPTGNDDNAKEVVNLSIRF
jgi:hypothetical protein